MKGNLNKFYQAGGGEKQEKTKDKTHPSVAVWLKLVASYQDLNVRGVDYQYLLDIDQCFKTDKDVDPVRSLQLQVERLEKTIAKQNDTLVRYARLTEELLATPEAVEGLSLESRHFLASLGHGQTRDL